jgi:hypothetical protein
MTWSWASIDGPIHYDFYTLGKEGTSHVDILDYLCIPESPMNLTGTLTGGHITVRGLLMPVLPVTHDTDMDKVDWIEHKEDITDSWRGHVTWVPGSDLNTREVSCDLPQATTAVEKSL